MGLTSPLTLRTLMENIACVDFETKEIDFVTNIPPKPVGLAILINGKSKYMAFGHPTNNNCTEEEARNELQYLYNRYPILLHNSAFDLGVVKQHWNLGYPRVVHDTLFLLFLKNPHAKTLSLKPSAESLLNLPPLEQEELKNWIIRHVPKANLKNWGAHISEAPGDLVGKYAIGDVERTMKLFALLYDSYKGEAYERECNLVRILIDNQLKGIRVDKAKLEVDYKKYTITREIVDKKIFSYLSAKPFNLNSSDELADALDKSSLDIKWVPTPTGKRSTSKANLRAAIQDGNLLTLLDYRSTLSTYLETFMGPWLEKTQGDYIHFSWNQVRNEETGNKGIMGTRTGRLSSSPSMLNVPVNTEVLPQWEDLGLEPLPFIRSYLLPDEGQQWLKRDYASQELRVLAHYEDGALLKAYVENPALDMHEFMGRLLTVALGFKVSRKDAKTIAFGILYGMAAATLAERLNVDYQKSIILMNTYYAQIPGLKDLQKAIKYKWGNNLPIKTFGGRLYYKEPSKLITVKSTGLQRMQDFTYKGLNYLIQGSSADVTKQAIINYEEIRHKDSRFLLAVHDELNTSGHPSRDLSLMAEAMHAVELDCPLLSDPFTGLSYGGLTDLETYNEEHAPF